MHDITQESLETGKINKNFLDEFLIKDQLNVACLLSIGTLLYLANYYSDIADNWKHCDDLSFFIFQFNIYLRNYCKIFGRDVALETIIEQYQQPVCKFAQSVPELRPLLFMFRVVQNIYLITAAEQKPLVSAINILDHQTFEVLEQMSRVDTDPELAEK